MMVNKIGSLMATDGILLGTFRIVSIQTDGCVVAKFDPTEEFKVYRSLFDEHEQLVNDQVFSDLDNLEKTIMSYNFRILTSNKAVLFLSDIQVMNNNDLIFRIS